MIIPFLQQICNTDCSSIHMYLFRTETTLTFIFSVSIPLFDKQCFPIAIVPYQKKIFVISFNVDYQKGVLNSSL